MQGRGSVLGGWGQEGEGCRVSIQFNLVVQASIPFNYQGRRGWWSGERAPPVQLEAGGVATAGGLAVGSLDQGGYDFVRRFESVTHLLGGNGKVNYLWPVICDLGTRL